MFRTAMMSLPLLWPGLVSAQEAPASLVVPAKEVPIPTTISPALQKWINKPIAPPVEMPTDAEGWRKLQQQADSAGEKAARAAATTLNVKVVPANVSGVPCFRITPSQIAPGNENRLIVHVHGGAFVFNAGLAGTTEGILLASTCKMQVLSIDYRMPPDHPFPAAPDDVLAVWKRVLRDHDASKSAMAGTSAGGGLIMTAMLRLKEQGLAMPAALFLGTPGADLTKSGDSVFLNAEVDHRLGRYEGRIEACLKLYAGGRDLKDPLLSPLNGDLSGFPPTILITGTRDLLLSATARIHRKLRSAGIPAELHVYEGQSHADYLASYPSPESQDALKEICSFFDRYLKR